MLLERKYILPGDTDLVKRIIAIDKALRKKFYLIDIDGDRELDNTYSVSTSKQKLLFDSAREFRKVAAHILKPARVEFCTSYVRIFDVVPLFYQEDNKSIWLVGTMDMGDWNLTATVGSLKGEFINKAISVIESGLNLNSPNRPNNTPSKSRHPNFRK